MSKVYMLALAEHQTPDRVLFGYGVYIDRKKALKAATSAQADFKAIIKEGTVEVLLIELELHT